MKKISFAIITFVIVFMTSQAIAQSNSLVRPSGAHPTKTLFGNSIDKMGLFLGPAFKITEYNDQPNYAAGFEGALVLNRRLFMGLLYENSGGAVTDTPYYYNSLGTVFGFFHNADRLGHLAAKVSLKQGRLVANHFSSQYTDSFVVVEPSLEFMLNLMGNMKLGTGVSYRFVDGVNQSAISSKSLWGAEVSARLLLGWF